MQIQVHYPLSSIIAEGVKEYLYLFVYIMSIWCQKEGQGKQCFIFSVYHYVSDQNRGHLHRSDLKAQKHHQPVSF